MFLKEKCKNFKFKKTVCNYKMTNWKVYNAPHTQKIYPANYFLVFNGKLQSLNIREKKNICLFLFQKNRCEIHYLHKYAQL